MADQITWNEIEGQRSTWTAKQEGDAIEGLFLAKDTSNKYANPTQIYTIRTKDNAGNLQDIAVFGRKSLDDRMSKVELGSYVRITFLGWNRTKSGKQFKDFKVEVGKPKNESPIERSKIPKE